MSGPSNSGIINFGTNSNFNLSDSSFGKISVEDDVDLDGNNGDTGEEEELEIKSNEFGSSSSSGSSSCSSIIDENIVIPKRPKRWWGQRHTVAILCFFATMNAYAMR